MPKRTGHEMGQMQILCRIGQTQILCQIGQTQIPCQNAPDMQIPCQNAPDMQWAGFKLWVEMGDLEMIRRAIDRIKDAIYNKSDVFVALVIICLASALIFWRIDIIMTYPETLAASVASDSAIDTSQEPATTDGSISVTPGATTNDSVSVTPGATTNGSGGEPTSSAIN